MAGFSGKWETVTKSPMGAQASTLTLKEETGVLTGVSNSLIGEIPLQQGKVEGRRATWVLKMNVPMPLTLEADVTLESDDSFSGGLKAGGFGTWPMSGKRSA